MGRTEARHDYQGAMIRRGARVGGGVVILPGIEIGEEAFVAAGALVSRDVPRATAVGREPRPATCATSPPRSCSAAVSGHGASDDA